ncbi:MAG: thiopurine S-methyltransferase [Pseudoxanthomonas sp.]
MNPDFWLQRWQENQIGFHQSAPTPWLLKHWPSLNLSQGAQVFVPLCGKSLDMAWLAAQGHRVLGVELSPLAVQQFFAEHGLQPEISTSKYGQHFVASNIEIILGDAFALDDEVLRDCAGVFDRAAIIALPPALRQRYAHDLYAKLPHGCRGVLVTLEYPQAEFAGPPHAVPEDEVHALFDANWQIELVDRREIPHEHPGHVGDVSRLDTAIYTMRRR